MTPARRRQSGQCPVCKNKFKVGPLGRPRKFCSRSCSQRAYEHHKWSRPHPVELLARDLATVQVRALIRRTVREVLQEEGIITTPPPLPKPKRRSAHLRIVEKQSGVTESE